MVTPSRKTSSAGSLRDELTAERAKLAGIAAQATKNATDGQLRDRSTHTGTQPADTITDGTTNKAYTAAERTKLAGVATGATANDTDANLKSRANHTGTQPADTIVDGTVNKVYTATDKTKLGALPDNATLQTSIGNRIAATEKGAANGVPTLDSNGKVPAVQLPSYVDDVLEFANVAAFPATGESGKIYVAQDTNKTYRWSGSAYPEISASPGSTDAVTEGSSNLYFTAQRVRDTLLAGVSFATNAVIAASDSFIVALGKLQAQISSRLQFDAAQTLTAGQKTQGQTNLGVDPTTLDARYNRLSQVIGDSQLPGRLGPALNTLADLDAFNLTGWAYAGPATANNVQAGGYYLIRYHGDADNGWQWALNLNGADASRRRRQNGVWQARLPIYETQAELDTRYLQPIGSRDIQIQKTNNPAFVVRALDGTPAFVRLRNTTGFYDIALDGAGNLAFNNYNSDDTYQNTPLYFQNDGTPVFQLRPVTAGGWGYETRDARGVAGGYASLDANGMVPAGQLPVNGSYKGSWNANTNTPTITAGVGANGDEYTVSVAGTNSITGTSTAWSVGDRAKFTTNGNKWERIPSVQAVNSVNGQTGVVVLAKSDVGLGNVDNTADLNKPVSTAQQAALNLKAPAASPTFSGTVSFPGTGANNIVAGTGDGATFTTYNFKVHAHWGIGFEAADGQIYGVYDARTGSWNVKGGYFLNGVAMAPTVSPAFSGTPTAPTAALGTNTNQIATMAALKAGLDALVAAAPGALDTLDELAAALGDDPNFRTTILNAIAAKEAAFDTLDGGTV